MSNLQICPPYLSDVATLLWEIQKSHFSTLLFIYFRLFPLAQKKTSSNCCSAALAIYSLLSSASCYLHSASLGHATGGSRVLLWTCWGVQQRLVATWAEFQHSVVYYVTEQLRKRLKACINAERGHSEHLLWHCLPDIPVATSQPVFPEPPMTTHNWLFSDPPAFERTQQTFNQIKKFCNSQVSVVTYSGGVQWITDFFSEIT